MPDDRGAGGRDLGRLGPPRAARRGDRPRGPLQSDHYGDHPRRRRRARCMGDAGRARRGHRAHPPRRARLAGDLPPPERARAHGYDRRPHLGRARRRGHGLGLVRQGTSRTASRSSTGGSASTCSPSRWRSSSAPGPGSASTREGAAYELRDRAALPRPLQQPHPARARQQREVAFAALAARYASEVNTLGATNDELRERKTRLDRACADAGRDRRRSATR